MRAVPSLCPPSAPLGERRVLERLQAEGGTDGWVVLHSLELQRHARKRLAQADFVLLVPALGVLTIEVKGCPVLYRGGQWTYQYSDGPKTSAEGPFRQAAGASEAIRTYVASRDAVLGTLLYSHLVMFLIDDFDASSPEWFRWQFLNRTDWLRDTLVPQLRRVMEAAHSHVRTVPNARWYDPERSRPTPTQVSHLVGLLRPDFEKPAPPGAGADAELREQERFTEEQFDALDAMDSHDRVVYSGPAGTGKTYLALEACRREAIQGHRVLLLCFNTLLGDWLRTWLDRVPEMARNGGWAGTFHRRLTTISGTAAPAAPDSWWRDELPRKCVELLLQSTDDQTYDVLVIDEAQDLVSDAYADVLDLLLRKGLARGRWRMFGDFEKQAIYAPGADAPDIRAVIKRRFGSEYEYRLTVNCRNAVKIGQAVMATCGLQPGYKRFLNSLEGVASPMFWTNAADQRALLERELDSLQREFRRDQIVVLSTRRDDESVAMALVDRGNSTLVPLKTNTPPNKIRFGTIHSFKGLEAPAVVLTDLTDLSSVAAQRLMYVGMTRARLCLRLLLQESCREQYAVLIRRTLQM